MPANPNPLAAQPVEAVAETTGLQRDMWVLDRHSAESAAACLLALRIDLHGEFDRSAALAALQRLYERHDALRATFPDVGEMRIGAPRPLRVELVDLASLPPLEREARLAERLRLAVSDPLDVRAGPLFRAELIALQPTHHVVLLKAHHIICDGWSLGTLQKEFALLYLHALGRGSAPPPAPSFAQFVRARVTEAKAREQQNAAFWSRVFDPLPPALDLPTAWPRPPRRSAVSARLDHPLDPRLIERVRRQGGAQGLTLFSMLFAAFNVVLSRICGSRDVVVGVPVAGQLRPGQHELVGLCLDFLPIRSAVDSESSFAAFAGAGRKQLLTAMRHGGYSLSELLALLKVRRDPSRLPLINVVFTSVPESRQTVPDGLDLRMRGEQLARPYEQFEVLAEVVVAGDQPRIECQYNSSLFDEMLVRGWLQSLEAVLERAADDLSVPCRELPVSVPTPATARSPARPPGDVDAAASVPRTQTELEVAALWQ
ncbi:MAG TPA: condensation domain-containing protein, partial [Burkholderiaceae bacterium]|nr:condensation domain-containing protein [Burkholderiaceae bacterium]